MVEGSADNCAIALACLQETPYRIEVAQTSAVARKMFTSSYDDLMLIDRRMPVTDGLSATRTIRAWEKANGGPSTPINASALKADRKTCLAAGCRPT